MYLWQLFRIKSKLILTLLKQMKKLKTLKELDLFWQILRKFKEITLVLQTKKKEELYLNQINLWLTKPKINLNLLLQKLRIQRWLISLMRLNKSNKRSMPNVRRKRMTTAWLINLLSVFNNNIMILIKITFDFKWIKIFIFNFIVIFKIKQIIYLKTKILINLKSLFYLL